MKCLLVSFLFCFVAQILHANVSDDEYLWSTDEGNSQNTFHIIPSIATNYSGKTWQYEYNSSSQDLTNLGIGGGVNGDVYFFLSETRYHPIDFIICLTTNGVRRWKLYIESVADMIPVGASNIVSDRNGTLYYSVSWTGNEEYTAKICRIKYAQTDHPYQECIKNYQLYMDINSPLAINEKFNLLITAVVDDTFESVPAAINKTTFEILWINRNYFGAGMNGHYKIDSKTGDMYWIGGDDYLLKFNEKGQKLLNGDSHSGGGRQFVLDNDQQIIVRSWQNMSDIRWPIVVSSWNVSKQFQLRWNWYAPKSIAENDAITQPIMDEKGITYLSSMPLIFALSTTGKTLWSTILATNEEMKNFELISWCLAMNSHTRILYVVAGSPLFHKGNAMYFITAVHMDTGKVLKRININHGIPKLTPSCPILIGDDMFYVFWLTGQYPDLVPLKLAGIPQVQP
ncbi:unnamed protein product [Rotaria sp. Silwood1]|nr:unnamed protein product [Rotaria sp. Silwood1]